MDEGQHFDIHAAGMLALDVARIEAGLLLIEVDYTSSKKALIPSQKYSPFELGMARMVHFEKENFHGTLSAPEGTTAIPIDDAPSHGLGGGLAISREIA